MANIAPGNTINASDILSIVAISGTTAATIKVSPNGTQVMTVIAKGYQSNNTGGPYQIGLFLGSTQLDLVECGNTQYIPFTLVWTGTPSATTNATVSIQTVSGSPIVSSPVISVTLLRTI